MYSLDCQCRLEKYTLFLGNLYPFYIYKWVNIAQDDKKVHISKKGYTVWSVNEGLSGNLRKPPETSRPRRFTAGFQKIGKITGIFSYVH